MRFAPFDYMAWAKAHQGRYRHDLSVSGMAAPDTLALDPAALTLQGMTAELRAALKAAIADAHALEADQVVLAAGTSEANFLVYALLLEAGAKVLVETPTYQVLSRMGSLFGAQTLTFARVAADQYALDLTRIQRAWQPGVKLLVLTSPHNPSGFAVSADAFYALGEWLERHDAYALVDEVYRDFNPQPAPVAQAIHPRLISTASLTKVYGLGALRAGWALLPAPLARRAEQLYDYMAVNPAAIPWRLALSAFPHLPAMRAHAQQRATENRARLSDWLPACAALAGALPSQGIVSLLQLTRETDARALCERLRDRHQLLLTPGDFFGAPGTVRLAYGAEPAAFIQALACLGAALACDKMM